MLERKLLEEKIEKIEKKRAVFCAARIRYLHGKGCYIGHGH